jgi:hypothetical protein
MMKIRTYGTYEVSDDCINYLWKTLGSVCKYGFHACGYIVEVERELPDGRKAYLRRHRVVWLPGDTGQDQLIRLGIQGMIAAGGYGCGLMEERKT